MLNEKEAIGFIGIGLMGKPMTVRLLQAGYKVTVWNRTLEKTDRFKRRELWVVRRIRLKTCFDSIPTSIRYQFQFTVQKPDI